MFSSYDFTHRRYISVISRHVWKPLYDDARHSRCECLLPRRAIIPRSLWSREMGCGRHRQQKHFETKWAFCHAFSRWYFHADSDFACPRPSYARLMLAATRERHREFRLRTPQNADFSRSFTYYFDARAISNMLSLRLSSAFILFSYLSLYGSDISTASCLLRRRWYGQRCDDIDASSRFSGMVFRPPLPGYSELPYWRPHLLRYGAHALLFARIGFAIYGDHGNATAVSVR